MKKLGTLVIVAALALSCAESVLAAEKAARQPASIDKTTLPKGMRKKEINFEERVIEGMSGRGYDSLSQTGTREDQFGERLYRKRAGFEEESKILLREMEYRK